MRLLPMILIVGDTEQIDKLNRRLVKVSKTHNDECKQLLKLMGIPYVEVSIILYDFWSWDHYPPSFNS